MKYNLLNLHTINNHIINSTHLSLSCQFIYLQINLIIIKNDTNLFLTNLEIRLGFANIQDLFYKNNTLSSTCLII